MKNKANEATTSDNAHKVHNLKDGDEVVDEGSVHTGDSFIVPCITLEQKKANNIDEILDVEMGDNGEIELGLTQSDKEDDAQKLHNLQDSLNPVIPCCEQEDDVMQNKANEAATFDSAPKVPNLNDDNVVVDEGSGAHTGHLFIVPCNNLEDHCQAEKDVESASVDLLLAHDDVVKNRGSPDGLDKIEDQVVHPDSCKENSGNKFIFEYEQQKKANNIDEILDVEMGHNGGIKLRLTQSDKEDAQKLPKFQDDTQKLHEFKIDLNVEIHSSGEEDVMQTEATKAACDTSTDNARTEEDYMVQDEADEGVRETSTDNATKLHCLKEDDVGSEAFTGALELETVNNMNERLDVEMDHNVGTEVGLIQSDKEDDAHKLHEVQNDVPQPDDVPETQQVGREVEKCVAEGLMLQHCTTNMLEFDLHLCAEKLKVWTARFLNSARRKVEENQKSNLKLQKNIEEQNNIIQQYELMLQKERQQKQQYELMLQKEWQQKQAGDRKYERELHHMKRILEDYRKAIKETNNSFAKYRERAQLPEEPLYMPHPDGGGDVILVSEWKELQEERQKMAIQTMVENFEEVCSAYLEEEISTLNHYCDRLEGLEHIVETMRERL